MRREGQSVGHDCTPNPTQLAPILCPLSFVVLLQREGHEHNVVPMSVVGNVDDDEVLK